MKYGEKILPEKFSLLYVPDIKESTTVVMLLDVFKEVVGSDRKYAMYKRKMDDGLNIDIANIGECEVVNIGECDVDIQTYGQMRAQHYMLAHYKSKGGQIVFMFTAYNDEIPYLLTVDLCRALNDKINTYRVLMI